MRTHFLQQYVQYIYNTKQCPLAVSAFDNDWEPIGPIVRRDLVASGLVTEWYGGIMLTDAGEAMLDEGCRYNPLRRLPLPNTM